MDDSVGRESSDHKGDSYQKHWIKVVTKLSGYCIDENRRIERVKSRTHTNQFIHPSHPS